VDSVPDPLLLRKCGSAGNRTLTTRQQRRSVKPDWFLNIANLKTAGFLAVPCTKENIKPQSSVPTEIRTEPLRIPSHEGDYCTNL
jgi:hypothetical protein